MPTILHYNTNEAYKLMHDGILALSRAEQQGLRVDVEYIQKKKKELSKQIIDLENQFYDSKFYKDWKKSVKKEINIYSSKQLGDFIYGVRNHKVRKETKTGKGSTDEEALQQFNIPELNILLRIGKLKKVRDTYLDSFEREQVDGYLHPFFNLHLVRTFRSSSDSPNFQNIPKRDKEAMYITRKALLPRPGHQLLELDYKQLEVRIAACYNQDEKLIYDIIHGDMHLDMAKEIFKIKKFDKTDPTHGVLRQAAKNSFVFPEFYGDYYVNCATGLAVTWGELPEKSKWKNGQGIKFEKVHLADHLIQQGFTDLESFKEHIRKIEYQFWKKRYKTYDAWKEKWWREYQENGYFYSKTGFTFQGVMSRNDVINYPVQGAAFHVLLWSLIEATKTFLRGKEFKTRIVGQIHDAIILDVYPPELEQIVKIMKCIMCSDVVQHWDWINVPLEIDAELCPVDASWADKQPYNIEEL